MRTLHGVFRTMRPDDDLASGRMHYHDAYRGTRDGRAVTIANAWIAIEAVVAGGRHMEGAAVTAVELSTLLMIGGIEPRLRHQGIQGPRYRRATRPSIPHTASSGWLASPRAS